MHARRTHALTHARITTHLTKTRPSSTHCVKVMDALLLLASRLPGLFLTAAQP